MCHLQNFDFQALEEAAGYDGGFTAWSRTIRWMFLPKQLMLLLALFYY